MSEVPLSEERNIKVRLLTNRHSRPIETADASGPVEREKFVSGDEFLVSEHELIGLKNRISVVPVATAEAEEMEVKLGAADSRIASLESELSEALEAATSEAS